MVDIRFPLRYRGFMTFPDLASEALKLPPDERARLAEALLESLDELTAEENEKLWLEEARRRDRELDDDPKSAIPADEAFRQIRKRLG